MRMKAVGRSGDPLEQSFESVQKENLSGKSNPLPPPPHKPKQKKANKKKNTHKKEKQHPTQLQELGGVLLFLAAVEQE